MCSLLGPVPQTNSGKVLDCGGLELEGFEPADLQEEELQKLHFDIIWCGQIW